MFQRLLIKFRTFMYGRNGSDPFNIALLVIYVALSILASCFRRIPIVYAVLYLLSLAVLVLFFWRFFSKNLASRQLENERFMNWFGPKRYAFQQWKKRSDDKEHIYVKCKNCKQRLRLPRHRGKLNITCPKCGTQFIKKT